MANKGNFIEAEGLVKRLNDAFTDHVKVVQMSVQTVKSLNDEYKKLPSDYANGLKQVAQAQEKSVQATNKLIQSKKQANQQTAQEVVNNGILNQNAKRQVLVNSQLAGAYRNLSAQVSIASERYQNLIVRGKTAEQTQRQYNRELRQARNEFRTLQTRVLQADKAVDKWNRTGQRSVRFGRELLAVLGVGGLLTVMAGIVKSVFELTKEFDGLNRALKLVATSTEIFTQSQAFLRKTAEDFGVDLSQLTKQYTQFYVSAKDKISSTEIQAIFRSISKGASAMGLSVEQQQRAFLALNQMMSKGAIQAEELRGQLGEALPGAFGIMAKAVGVTEIELGKMMKAGELLASDVLPKFAKQLEKTYGIETLDRIESLTASQQRLTIAWEAYVASLQAGEGTTSRIFKYITDSFANLLRMSERIDKIGLFRSLKGGLPQSEIVEKGVNAIDEGFLKTEKTSINYYKGEIERVKEVVSYYKKLANELKGASNLRSQEIMDKAGISGANTTAENQKIINEYLNANIKIQNIVTAKLNEEQLIRNKLIGQHIALNKEKQKGVSQDVLFDVAKSKTNEQLKKEIALMSNKTDATKDNTKAKKENNAELTKVAELVVGSVNWLQKEISVLREQQSALSTTSEEYQKYETEIKTLTGSLDILIGKQKEVNKVLEDAGVTISDSDLIGEGLDNWYKDELDKFKQNTAGALDDTETDWLAYSQQVLSYATELTNQIMELDNIRYQNQLTQLEKQKATDLKFAGDNAEAKLEIERQYEEKRAQIQRKQAQSQKKQAIFNAIINTAQGIMSTIGNVGFPTAIPLIALIGAIGAMQIATISAQQIPEFYKGTDNAPEGYAWTQERGAEIIADKSGKIKSLGTNKGAQLTHLNKGDKVFTANESREIMFNNDLNNILLNNGISGSNTVVNNSVDLSPLNDRIDNLASIIKNKSSITIVNDRRGKRIFEEKQKSRKELVSNTIRANGQDV